MEKIRFINTKDRRRLTVSEQQWISEADVILYEGPLLPLNLLGNRKERAQIIKMNGVETVDKYLSNNHQTVILYENKTLTKEWVLQTEDARLSGLFLQSLKAPRENKRYVSRNFLKVNSRSMQANKKAPMTYEQWVINESLKPMLGTFWGQA